jgi:hypothetical protein
MSTTTNGDYELDLFSDLGPFDAWNTNTIKHHTKFKTGPLFTGVEVLQDLTVDGKAFLTSETKRASTLATTNCALDFSLAQGIDLALFPQTNVFFADTNAAGSATNMQRRSFFARTGPNSVNLYWPAAWSVINTNLPASAPAQSLIRLNLESLGSGPSNIVATVGQAADNSGTWDASALAYFSRVGAISGAEQSAVNTMTIALKTNGFWSKLYAVYPFCGNSSNGCSQNLVSTNYGIVYNSGVTYLTNGIKGNGGSGQGNTGFTNTVTTNLSLGVCITAAASSTNAVNNGGVFIGCYENTGHSWINNQYVTAFTSAMGQAGSADSLSLAGTGMLLTSRTNSTSYGSVDWTGASHTIAEVTSIAAQSVPIYLLTDKPNDQNTDALLGLAFIGQGFTTSDMTNLWTIFNNYRTALGR